MTKHKKYSRIIDALGGSAKVARDLGYAPANGVQRVNNWKARGIPPRVLLNHAKYFTPVKTLIRQAETV